jgi:hypothetical protein
MVWKKKKAHSSVENDSPTTAWQGGNGGDAPWEKLAGNGVGGTPAE